MPGLAKTKLEAAAAKRRTNKSMAEAVLLLLLLFLVMSFPDNRIGRTEWVTRKCVILRVLANATMNTQKLS